MGEEDERHPSAAELSLNRIASSETIAESRQEVDARTYRLREMPDGEITIKIVPVPLGATARRPVGAEAKRPNARVPSKARPSKAGPRPAALTGIVLRAM